MHLQAARHGIRNWKDPSLIVRTGQDPVRATFSATLLREIIWATASPMCTHDDDIGFDVLRLPVHSLAKDHGQLRSQSFAFFSAESLCIAMWSVLSLLISY